MKFKQKIKNFDSIAFSLNNISICSDIYNVKSEQIYIIEKKDLEERYVDNIVKSPFVVLFNYCLS